jgi:succinate dehydrogenase / fumarate reductase, cytochrome b subunit
MAQVTAPGTLPGAKRRKPFLLEVYSTAIGKKYVMALTGVGIVLFALAHMVGNLKMYLGRTSAGVPHINEYGEFLRRMGEPILPHTVLLWILRLGLIGMFALHMHSAYSLTIMNRRAREVQYQSKRDYLAANFASRTMRWTGMIFFLFLVWHLADLTWGFVNTVGTNQKFIRGEVLNNLDNSLSRWWVALLYVVANLALATHLYHGAWSFFQSVGLNNPRFTRFGKLAARGLAALIIVGNLTFPILILAGAVHR